MLPTKHRFPAGNETEGADQDRLGRVCCKNQHVGIAHPYEKKYLINTEEFLNLSEKHQL